MTNLLFCMPRHHPGPGLLLQLILIVLWVGVSVVSAVFGYGVARESKTRLVRTTGYLLVLSFIPLIMFIGIPIGLVFSYGVAKESRSRWVRMAGFLLAAVTPVVGMVGLLWGSQGWTDSLIGLAWTSVAILASGFCFCVARESKSRLARTPGFILAATGVSLVLVGWMIYAYTV